MPLGACENNYTVYRACATGKVDRLSFLNSYEENGFCTILGLAENDPSQYSLSTFEKPRDVKRFATMNSSFKISFKIAKGTTNPIYGYSQRTKERDKSKKKSSHVDWWLYENATPENEFDLIQDFNTYLSEYKLKNEEALR